MKKNVLLNLDTLVDRPKIAIDGKRYEILSPDELPVLVSHKLAMQGKRLDELSGAAELAPEDKAELEQLVLDLSDTIMEPIPAAVRAKLSDAQRLSVIEAFSTLLLTRKAGAAAAMMTALIPTASPPAQTGGKSSRGSSASTADRPATGSAKRRSRS